MWQDRASNPGPLALESDALPTVLRGPVSLVIGNLKYYSCLLPDAAYAN